MPQNLLQQIQDFEEKFTVDQTKLKEIVAHFVKELEKGELGADLMIDLMIARDPSLPVMII